MAKPTREILTELASIETRLAEIAAEALPYARRSLAHTVTYLSAIQDERGLEALRLLDEQDQVLERITRAGLIPYPASSEVEERRAFLDEAIDRLRHQDPLLARYGDLHDRRLAFLPSLN